MPREKLEVEKIDIQVVERNLHPHIISVSIILCTICTSFEGKSDCALIENKRYIIYPSIKHRSKLLNDLKVSLDIFM